ncbi:MAG: membrane protein insertion efficiency factor YidD [Planctomycetota bacterium]|nr:MAG: membrane protein insertion efficiency factor YidD [Planctomycetota bacterium]
MRSADFVRRPGRALSAVLIGLVYLYKITLSPWLGTSCRFTPTCSTYFIEAVRKYGPIKGAAKGIWRILRCNPFCKGGYDPP